MNISHHYGLIYPLEGVPIDAGMTRPKKMEKSSAGTIFKVVLPLFVGDGSEPKLTSALYLHILSTIIYIYIPYIPYYTINPTVIGAYPSYKLS